MPVPGTCACVCAYACFLVLVLVLVLVVLSLCLVHQILPTQAHKTNLPIIRAMAYAFIPQHKSLHVSESFHA